jgi:uncharacterized protein Yka (UPF0111/DUF47 family)
MAVKTKILEVIGGGKSDLLVMEKVRRALQANERVKYLLTLLQLAQAQAQTPSPQPDDLSVERRRAGIEDTELDQVIPQATLVDGDRLAIPVVDKILELAFEETARMCDPLVVARGAEGSALKDRLTEVSAAVRSCLDGAEASDGSSATGSARAAAPSGGAAPEDGAPPETSVPTLPLALIGRLTSAERLAGDTLHLVVMDAHKAINSLISELSAHRETVAGADALGLTEEDRKLVQGFAAGVNSTRGLKGGHPGLATTAVRMGSKLMIQNDVGETDAHVVILEIEDGRLELTYTDVHDKRIEFFSSLMSEIPIKWKKTESRFSSELSEGAFILARGVLHEDDPDRMAHALGVIGGSLVFLIDWNRARKRLRTFLRGGEVLEILVWAARERIGHMSFLSYGDEELIYEALEALPRGTVRRGEPLTSILGRKGAVEFVKDTLRLCGESYQRQEPRALLLDRLRVSLLARAQKRGRGADEMLLELAGLAVETALSFRDSIRGLTRPIPGLIERNYQRICQWEERADERLGRIRKLHLKEPQALLPVGDYVDDALDALEDAGNLALALEAHFDKRVLPAEMMAMLEEAAELTLRASQLFFRVLHRYRELVRGGIGEALFDEINFLKQTEVEGDKLKRAFRWKFLSMPGDSRVLVTLRELGDEIESALNALSRAGFLIHDLAYAAMERSHG